MNFGYPISNAHLPKGIHSKLTKHVFKETVTVPLVPPF